MSAPLTDEEIATWMEKWKDFEDVSPVRRMLATIQAARQENAELRKALFNVCVELVGSQDRRAFRATEIAETAYTKYKEKKNE